MNIIFLGAPGSGKGTQAQLVAERYGLLHISTGDLLRDYIQNKDDGTIKTMLAQGKLVDDAFVFKLLEDAIDESTGANGVIFDGFPRTVAQAEMLDAMVAKRGEGIAYTVFFKVDEELLVQRIVGRRTCPSCKKVFNVYYSPSKNGINCDSCNSPLTQREDDTAEKVKVRVDVYHDETQPLIDYYQKNLVAIDAAKAPQHVTAEIVKKTGLNVQVKMS